MKHTRWYGPPCPQDATHGQLLDWPNATGAWYCPSARHVGMRFYTTDLIEAPRGAAVERVAPLHLPPAAPQGAPVSATRGVR